MKNKDTDGLRQELMDSPNLTQFLSQNKELFANKSIAQLLTHLFEKNIYQRRITLMDIVALLEVLVKEIIAAEEKFLKNPKDFYSLETSVKASTEIFLPVF